MAVAGAALAGKETDAPGEPEYAPVAALPALPGRRLASIDALRGFDMFWLMQEESGLVLALAAALHLPFQAVLAKQLDHTPWVGITFWDLIAPLFLFIVGLILPFAIQSRLRRGGSRKTILFHILRRTALLIVLGLVFNGILQLNFSDFRYTGVLQRIRPFLCFCRHHHSDDQAARPDRMDGRSAGGVLGHHGVHPGAWLRPQCAYRAR